MHSSSLEGGGLEKPRDYRSTLSEDHSLFLTYSQEGSKLERPKSAQDTTIINWIKAHMKKAGPRFLLGCLAKYAVLIFLSRLTLASVILSNCPIYVETRLWWLSYLVITNT
ncbi:hypothetical protein BY458DRAFT_210353 [Sporodiniella umbellata]|nr:hypothetical protein BY458DRAFT_210353 [Sporodiniella umbellata]